MQATRGKTNRISQDIEQQNMTVAAKKRTGLSADIAEVCILNFFRPWSVQLTACIKL